jgi:hypothetical protein
MKSNDQLLLEGAYEGILGKTRLLMDMNSAILSGDDQKILQVAAALKGSSFLRKIAVDTVDRLVNDPEVKDQTKAAATMLLKALEE